jgi:hypothetical protein
MKCELSIPGLGLLCALAACGGNGPDAASTRSDAQAAATPPPLVASAEPSAFPTGHAASAGSPDSLAALRQEVTLLRKEVHELRDQVSRMPGAAQAAAAPPDPRVDPVARQQAQQAERQRIASAESAFQGERRDARWSQDQTAAIRSSLAQAGDGLSGLVRSIDCRAQTCRVEISAAGPALGQDLPMLLNQLGGNLPHMNAGQVDQGDGTEATVLYLSR